MTTASIQILEFRNLTGTGLRRFLRDNGDPNIRIPDQYKTPLLVQRAFEKNYPDVTLLLQDPRLKPGIFGTDQATAVYALADDPGICSLRLVQNILHRLKADLEKTGLSRIEQLDRLSEYVNRVNLRTQHNPLSLTISQIVSGTAQDPKIALDMVKLLMDRQAKFDHDAVNSVLMDRASFGPLTRPVRAVLNLVFLGTANDGKVISPDFDSPIGKLMPPKFSSEANILAPDSDGGDGSF